MDRTRACRSRSRVQEQSGSRTDSQTDSGGGADHSRRSRARSSRAGRSTRPGRLRFPRRRPDEANLIVSESDSKWIWSFRVGPDGDLGAGQPFYRLETWDEDSRSRADGMAFSADGWLLVATGIGLQLCDEMGRTVRRGRLETAGRPAVGRRLRRSGNEDDLCNGRGQGLPQEAADLRLQAVGPAEAWLGPALRHRLCAPQYLKKRTQPNAQLLGTNVVDPTRGRAAERHGMHTFV